MKMTLATIHLVFNQPFIFEVVIKSFIAIVLGSIIGLERETHNHPAGLRTHALVCFGASIVMMIGLYMQNTIAVDATSRLIQGVITGIGFIGAGTILRDGNTVRGLTTAATVWVTACIGLAVGIGMYIESVILTLFMLLLLIGFRWVEYKWLNQYKHETNKNEE
jgi:putative Mg2+ transporter-C (MgtC) family protein